MSSRSPGLSGALAHEASLSMIREKQIVCSESISEKSFSCSLPSSGVWVPKAHALGPRRFPQNQPAGAHPQAGLGVVATRLPHLQEYGACCDTGSPCGLPVKENSESGSVDENSVKISPNREPRARVPGRVQSRPSLTDLGVLTQGHHDVGHFLTVLRTVGPCAPVLGCYPRTGRGLLDQVWIFHQSRALQAARALAPGELSSEEVAQCR